jgi:hypothetical protein
LPADLVKAPVTLFSHVALRNLSGLLVSSEAYLTNLFVDFLFPRLYYVRGFDFGCHKHSKWPAAPLCLRSYGAVGFNQGSAWRAGLTNGPKIDNHTPMSAMGYKDPQQFKISVNHRIWRMSLRDGAFPSTCAPNGVSNPLFQRGDCFAHLPCRLAPSCVLVPNPATRVLRDRGTARTLVQCRCHQRAEPALSIVEGMTFRTHHAVLGRFSAHPCADDSVCFTTGW